MNYSSVLCSDEYLEAEARCDEIVIEIKTIQRSVIRTALASSVEIGRLLTEAKAKLPHGGWGAWLQDNFAYSQQTAVNLMRLYDAYGEKEQLDLFFENKMDIFGSLTPSQAIALLPLPEHERREFVETHDMEETSVRDIEREVRARREAEEMVEDLKQRLEDAESDRETAEREIREEYETKIEESEKAHSAEVKKLTDALAEARDQGSTKEKKADLKKKIEDKVRKELAAERAKLERELSEAQKSKGELETKLADAERQARDAAAAEYTVRLLELEERARTAERKAESMSDAATQKLAVHFENFQNEWNAMMALITEIRVKDDEKAEKLLGAVQAIAREYAGDNNAKGGDEE